MIRKNDEKKYLIINKVLNENRLANSRLVSRWCNGLPRLWSVADM